MWEFCTLSFQDSTLDLYYQLSIYWTPFWSYLFHTWLMICNTKRKPCVVSRSLQPIYPSLWRHFSQNGGTCWELNWPPTVPQSLSPFYDWHQIPATPYFIFFTPGLFSRISLAEGMWLSSAVSHSLPGNLIIWQPAFHCFRIVLNCFHSGQT